MVPGWTSQAGTSGGCRAEDLSDQMSGSSSGLSGGVAEGLRQGADGGSPTGSERTLLARTRWDLGAEAEAAPVEKTMVGSLSRPGGGSPT
jgi:hypothetical protein